MLYPYSGRPVVITDATKDWNIEAFSSFDKLAKEIPSLQSRREFNGASQLLNIIEKEDQEAIRKHYSVPYFFKPPDYDLANITLDTELFFFGEKGAKGFPMHLDTGCHQYWVPHFKGSKKWEMQPIVDRETAISQKRDPRWQFPILEATVNPGDILVFYSGWVHKTEYPKDEETVSFTMYIHRPMPKMYLEEYRHALVSRKEYSTCLDRWFSPDSMVGRRLARKEQQQQQQQKQKQGG